MTRNLILCLTLAPAIGAFAQQPAPPEGSSWQQVQALPAGASINVKTRTGNASCKLKSVDADTLTCTQKKDIVFEHTDILNIKIPRRGRSTLIGTAIGAGVGAGIGVASTGGNSCKGFCIISTGDAAAIVGVVGGIVGAVVGATTDFSRSSVYKAQ